MSQRLEGKIALVTGSASGIGKAIAQRFAEEGARLMLGDRNEADGSRGAQELGAVFRAVDVSKIAEVDALVASCVEHYGAVDILVNNAGVGSFGQVPDVDPEEWDRVLAIDLSSVFYGCRAVIPRMLEGGGGAIVNTASISGLLGDYGLAAYNAAKGGVSNLTRTLAIDHAGDGIRVNAVCPGPVDTALTEGLVADPGIMEEYRKLIPMHRIGHASEIASAVAFLASEDASFITGVNLVVDGGVTAATGQPNFTRLFKERGWYSKR
jgi:meso-butanediol dehydrogenase/(S,S)-butanediol dehydrogenase/diacetyl reductase